MNILFFRWGPDLHYSGRVSPYKPPPRVDDGRFRWEDVPIRYPASSVLELPTGKPKRLASVQHTFGAESRSHRVERLDRQQHVKDAFTRCWRSYRERAWMRDELSPISGGSRDAFGGWAATLVDSLDTLYMMGMTKEFDEAVTAVKDIDFSSTEEQSLNVFETTIRYMGGLLAAYDLSQEPALLDKAVELGEMLYVAFDTPNRMPVTRWNPKSAAAGSSQEAGEGTLVAEIGSLTLEFTRLSQLTKNPKWFDAIQRISEIFASQQSKTKLPGMWPVVVNARDTDFTGDTGFTLGGMADSLYEYFPKQYALLGGLVPLYRQLYEGSMATALNRAIFRPMAPSNPDILISGNVRAESPEDATLDPQGQHLTCFSGGMLALGGRLFDIPAHLTTAQKLVEGCIWAYDASLLGIMPETFHLVPCASTLSCTWAESEWHSAVKARASSDASTAVETIASQRLPPGFASIGDRRYILRPEAIESIFVLYRVTGNDTLQDVAWKMFSSIMQYSRTEFANAALDDVTVSDPPKSDRMESFWMAETLKYFYLIFSEPDHINLDDWVLNTEAHPFRRPT